MAQKSNRSMRSYPDRRPSTLQPKSQLGGRVPPVESGLPTSQESGSKPPPRPQPQQPRPVIGGMKQPSPTFTPAPRTVQSKPQIGGAQPPPVEKPPPISQTVTTAAEQPQGETTDQMLRRVLGEAYAVRIPGPNTVEQPPIGGEQLSQNPELPAQPGNRTEAERGWRYATRPDGSMGIEGMVQPSAPSPPPPPTPTFSGHSDVITSGGIPRVGWDGSTFIGYNGAPINPIEMEHVWKPQLMQMGWQFNGSQVTPPPGFELEGWVWDGRQWTPLPGTQTQPNVNAVGGAMS